MSFHLNFPDFEPFFFVTGQRFFSTTGYSDELVAIFQASF
jgi:hypothetical protein